MVDLGFFLAGVLKGDEIHTALFAEQEQQFSIVMWCLGLPSARDRAPGSGVSWSLGVSGAASVSDSHQGISAAPLAQSDPQGTVAFL